MNIVYNEKDKEAKNILAVTDRCPHCGKHFTMDDMVSMCKYETEDDQEWMNANTYSYKWTEDIMCKKCKQLFSIKIVSK